MAGKSNEPYYSETEARQRFEAALRGARAAGQKPIGQSDSKEAKGKPKKSNF
jgi:hypothetical protein